MDNLSETLKQQAISLGLCKQWSREWADNSGQQELIDKYVRGIDFCIEHQYPSNDFIKANFDRGLLHENLIYVDEHLDLDNAPSGIYILNGECTGTIRFHSWAAATIFVRHESRVNIEAGDFARLTIRIYDDAEVETSSRESSAVRIYCKS